MSLLRCLSVLALAALLGSTALAAPKKPTDRSLTALTDPSKLVARGRQLEERGDPVGAMTHYDAALAVDPQNVPALQAAGENALARGDGPLAFGYYSTLAAQQPKSADAQLGIAGSLILRQQPEAANAALRRATELGAPRVRTVSLEGLLRDLAGDLRAAQVAYAEALAVNPTDLQTGQRLAVSLAASGDRAAALQVMRRFGADGIDNFDVRRTLALVHALTGDLATANEIAGTILSPRDAETLGRFFERLPSLSQADKLRAAHYGVLPSEPKLAAAPPLAPPSVALAPVVASVPAAQSVAAPAAPVPTTRPQPLAPVRLAQPGAAARAWVQLASTSSPKLLGSTWMRVRSLGPVSGRLPYVQRYSGKHRLLIGPFSTVAAAQAAAARLKARGIDALALSTPPGADIIVLPGS
jgi:Flp pilus assembly protein TadD